MFETPSQRRRQLEELGKSAGKAVKADTKKADRAAASLPSVS